MYWQERYRERRKIKLKPLFKNKRKNIANSEYLSYTPGIGGRLMEQKACEIGFIQDLLASGYTCRI